LIINSNFVELSIYFRDEFVLVIVTKKQIKKRLMLELMIKGFKNFSAVKIS
jgi:hypothetical protein